MCKNHLCSCDSCSGYLTARRLIPPGVELVVIPGMEGCIFCSLDLGKLTPELVLDKITNLCCSPCAVYLTAKQLIPPGGELYVKPGLKECIFCAIDPGKLTRELVLDKIGKKDCIKCEFDEMMKPVVEPVAESSMVLEVPAVRVQNAKRFLRCTDCSRGFRCSPNCGCPPECGHNTHKRRPSVDFTGYSHETGVDGQSSKRILNMDDSDMN
jgi:hypothetical protein